MSNYINKAIFIENIKMFFLIPVVFVAIFLVFLIIPLHTTDNFQQVGSLLREILTGRNTLYMISVALFPLLMALFINGFNFDRAFTNAYNSFPVNRRIIFLTNFVSGLSLIIISLAVISLFLLIPLSYERLPFEGFSFFHGHTPFGVLIFFIRSVIIFSFYYSLFTLTITLSGNMLVAILFSAALSVFPFAAHLLILAISELFILGHPGISVTTMHHIITFIATMPLFYHDRIGFNIFPLMYLIQIIAFIVLAYFANKHRSAEKASTGVVFGWLENICIFLFSLFGAVTTPIVFGLLFGNIIAFHVGIFLGFLIFFILGQIILEKSFNIKNRLKLKIIIPNFLILIIGYVLINFSSFFFTFYVNRVPSLSTIESADIGLFGRNPLFFMDYELRETRLITNEETIQLIRELHEEILQNRNIKFFEVYDFFTQRQRGTTFQIPIIYNLTNGRTVTRVYTIFENSIPEDFGYKLSNDKNFILRDFTLLIPHLEDEISEIVVTLFRLTRTSAGWYDHYQSEIVSIYYDDPNFTYILEALRNAAVENAREELRLRFNNDVREETYRITASLFGEYNWQNTFINMHIENSIEFADLLDFEYSR